MMAGSKVECTWIGMLLLVVLLVMGSVPAAAQELVVQSFGGAFEEAQRELIVEPFEREYGVKVHLVTLYSAEALARLRASHGSGEIDVYQFSGGQEVQAIREGLTLPIDPDVVTNMKDLYSVAVNPHGHGPHLSVAALGLVYNEDLIDKAPTSWNELWNPAYAGHVAVVDITNTYGLQFLVLAAQMDGGGEHNIEPGFERVRRLLPNAVGVIPTTPEVMNMLAQEEIWMLAYDTGYAYNFRQQGLPVRAVIPDEGAMAIYISAQVAADSKNPTLAQQFINYALRPEVQVAFAERMGWAPTNRNAQLPPELAAVMPHGEEAINRLIALDWETVGENLSEWTEEWKRLIVSYSADSTGNALLPWDEVQSLLSGCTLLKTDGSPGVSHV